MQPKTITTNLRVFAFALSIAVYQFQSGAQTLYFSNGVPSIFIQPQSQVVLEGAVCNFSVTAIGTPITLLDSPTPVTIKVSSQGSTLRPSVVSTPKNGDILPLSYQWYHDNEIVIGETNSGIVITNVQSSSAGTYFVMVQNAYNPEISQNYGVVTT